MIVQKVRGENKIHPVKLTSVEAQLVRKMGIPLEKYVKEYIAMIAKKRRWKWYFERKKK